MQLLLILLMALHLLAVNLAGGGPLVASGILCFGGRRNLADSMSPADTLVRWSLCAAGIGIALGLLLLWAMTAWPALASSPYHHALREVTPGRWWFVVVEVAFYLVCLGLCLHRSPWFRSRPRLRALLAFAAGTDLLYHFPPLFTVLAIIAERPELQGLQLDRTLYRQLLLDPESIARVLHVWFASFAVGGLGLAWYGWQRSIPAGNTPPDDSSTLAPSASSLHSSVALSAARYSALGGRIALAFTLLQIPTGVWVMASIPNPQQQRLLGGNPLSTALLAGSLLASLALMHQLALLALGEFPRRRLPLATILLCGVVLLMTATLQLARG